MTGILPLTPRQAQVATLIAKGLTDDQIADTLGVSPCTVRLHIGLAFSRVGVRSRTALAVWWVHQAQSQWEQIV